jgi:hypothetical protein
MGREIGRLTALKVGRIDREATSQGGRRMSAFPSEADIMKRESMSAKGHNRTRSATDGIAGLLFNNPVGSEGGLAQIAKQHNFIWRRPLAVFPRVGGEHGFC